MRRQESFYVSHLGQQEGPMTLDQIVERVKSKTLEASDYLYDETAQDWVMLMTYPDLSERLAALKPLAPPTPLHPQAAKAKPDANTAEWYVLKGDNKFGPFGRNEIVRMLQEKTIFEYDYVWHAGMAAWERIANLEAFSPEAIRQLRESGATGLNEVFFRRRHARVGYGASLLVHDNRRVYKAKSIEVSQGGAGLVIENAVLQVGDRLYLHFKPGDGVPPFNAVCEIMSKRFEGATGSGAPVQYGVQFTELATHVSETLAELVKKVKAA